MSDLIYLFRPNAALRATTWLRYEPDSVADPRTGVWVLDDGRYGMAFIDANAPTALYVDLPTHEGIEWTWATNPTEQARYLDRPLTWHYQVADPEVGLGERREIFHPTHPNGVASRAAMDECCRRSHCANGRSVGFFLGSPYSPADQTFAAGLVRAVDPFTLLDLGMVVPPAEPTCFRCANGGLGHQLEELADHRDRIDNELADARERIQDARVALYDAEDAEDRAREQLREFDHMLVGSRLVAGA